MIKLALISSLLFSSPVLEESWQICEDMEHDLQQSVEFNIITEQQMNAILLRCLINYS